MLDKIEPFWIILFAFFCSYTFGLFGVLLASGIGYMYCVGREKEIEHRKKCLRMIAKRNLKHKETMS